MSNIVCGHISGGELSCLCLARLLKSGNLENECREVRMLKSPLHFPEKQKGFGYEGFVLLGAAALGVGTN